MGRKGAQANAIIEKSSGAAGNDFKAPQLVNLFILLDDVLSAASECDQTISAANDGTRGGDKAKPSVADNAGGFAV